MLFLSYGQVYAGESREDPQARPVSVPGLGDGRLKEKKMSTRDPGGYWWNKNSEDGCRLYVGGGHRQDGLFLLRDGWLFSLQDPSEDGTEAVLERLTLSATPPLSPSDSLQGAFTDSEGKEVAVSWSRAMGTGRRGKLKRGHAPSSAIKSYQSRTADIWAGAETRRRSGGIRGRSGGGFSLTGKR